MCEIYFIYLFDFNLLIIHVQSKLLGYNDSFSSASMNSFFLAFTNQLMIFFLARTKSIQSTASLAQIRLAYFVVTSVVHSKLPCYL